MASWGTNTTSEKEVLPAASAACTRSPALIREICRSSPDSSLTVSDPAKQALDVPELESVVKADCHLVPSLVAQIPRVPEEVVAVPEHRLLPSNLTVMIDPDDIAIKWLH